MLLRDLLVDGLGEQDFYEALRGRAQREGVRQRWQKNSQWVSQRFPAARDRIIQQADEALRGMQVLPGTADKPYFVGNPPQWHANPVHDAEYVWGLNRMYHWRPLLQAWAFTGQAPYAQKVADELADWIGKCPRPAIDTQHDAARESFDRVTPWRSLEAGIRMFMTWPLVMDYLLGSEFMGPELLAKYAVSLHEHVEVLETICPIFWPEAAHNHYLMEMLGLMAVAVQIPEFKASAHWQSFAMRELERCAAAQLTAEGGQIEGCPHYHNGCAEFFHRAVGYAQRSGIAFSDAFMQRTRGAITYALESMRPTGVWSFGGLDSRVQSLLCS